MELGAFASLDKLPAFSINLADVRGPSKVNKFGDNVYNVYSINKNVYFFYYNKSYNLSFISHINYRSISGKSVPVDKVAASHNFLI